MHKTLLSGAATLSLATLALAGTLAPTTRNFDVETVSAQDQIRNDQAYSAPRILAQGRCYNGRCY